MGIVENLRAGPGSKRKCGPSHRSITLKRKLPPQSPTHSHDPSANGAPCESSGHRPGNVSQKSAKPCRGEIPRREILGPSPRPGKPTLLFRPFRACHCFTAQTQGDALGFHMAPRWGLGHCPAGELGKGAIGVADLEAKGERPCDEPRLPSPNGASCESPGHRPGSGP